MPPRSRLRGALLRRAAVSGWSAWSRWDLDLMLVRYAANCQVDVPPEFVSAGARSSYRGHAGVREWAADVHEAWERFDLTPHEIVDAGDRFVILGRIHSRASGSGVELDSRYGQVIWVERGLIVRQRAFFDWDAAYRTADLPTNDR